MASTKILAVPSIRRLPLYLHIIKQAQKDNFDYINIEFEFHGNLQTVKFPIGSSDSTAYSIEALNLLNSSPFKPYIGECILKPNDDGQLEIIVNNSVSVYDEDSSDTKIIIKLIYLTTS